MTLPPHLNMYQAEAWVEFRTTEAVADLQTWRCLSAERMYPSRERVENPYAILLALRSGAITALGAKPSQEFEPIPAVEWERMRFAPLDPSDHWPYGRVLLRSQDVERLWPANPAPTIYDWEKVRALYEGAGLASGMGKKRAAQSLKVLYEKEIGLPSPGYSTLERYIQSWRKGVRREQEA